MVKQAHSSDSVLPFDVTHHVDVDTVLGRALVSQMEEDVKLRRRAMSTAREARLLCLHQAHFARLGKFVELEAAAGEGRSVGSRHKQEATFMVLQARKQLHALGTVRSEALPGAGAWVALYSCCCVRVTCAGSPRCCATSESADEAACDSHPTVCQPCAIGPPRVGDAAADWLDVACDV